MMLMPSKKMMNLLIMVTIIFSLNSDNWLMVWFGMELNLMSLLPIMFSNSLSKEIEALIKYVIPQTLSSSLMLSSTTLMASLSAQPTANTILLTSLMIKLMVFPFHLWFPSIMSNSSWWVITIISTWQKVLPLLILINLFNSESGLLLFLLIMNAVTSTLMATNQTNLRPILAYSSIHHSSWFLVAGSYNKDTPMIYFILYSFIMINLTINLMLMKTTKTSHLNLNHLQTTYMVLPLILHFMNLSGVPPFMGFIPKLMVLSDLFSNNLSVIMPLTASSSLAVFFYSLIMFTMALNISKQVKPLITNSLLNLSLLLISTMLLLLL